MRAVKFIKKSPYFSDNEKIQLIKKFQAQIRWLIQSELSQEGTDITSTGLTTLTPAGGSEDKTTQTWKYGPFASKRTGNSVWRNELQNFLYDIDLELLDTDKDGSIFGMRYKKKSSSLVSSAPAADDPFDVAGRLLGGGLMGFTCVPVTALPTHLALGRGVMAYFRPPRDVHYSIQVFAASPFASSSGTATPTATATASASAVRGPQRDTSTGGERDQSPEHVLAHMDDAAPPRSSIFLRHPPPLSQQEGKDRAPSDLESALESALDRAGADSALPPFESSDFQFYAAARNRIEAKFLSFEDFLLRKIHGVVHSVWTTKENVLHSDSLNRAREAREVGAGVASHILAHLPSALRNRDRNRDRDRDGDPPAGEVNWRLHDNDLSNLNNLQHFWSRGGDAGRSTEEGSSSVQQPPPETRPDAVGPAGQSEGRQGERDSTPLHSSLLSPASSSSSSSGSISVSDPLSHPLVLSACPQEVVIAVRYRFLDQSFVMLRHLQVCVCECECECECVNH